MIGPAVSITSAPGQPFHSPEADTGNNIELNLEVLNPAAHSGTPPLYEKEV